MKIDSKKMSGMIIVFVFLAIVGGIFLYFSNPRTKFLMVINKQYKSFTNILEQVSNSKFASLAKESTLTSEGSLSFNLILSESMFGEGTDAITSAINDLKINYKYGSDPKNDNAYIKFSSFLKNKSLFDMDLYQLKDKKYLYYNGIYDKYIESNSIDYIKTDSTQAEDITYLINKIRSSLLVSLKPDDFTAAKASIKLNNETISTDKVSLKLTAKRINEIFIKILTDIKNDQKCIDILKQNSDQTDFKTLIANAIKTIQEDTGSGPNIMIDIYLKGSDVARLDIFSDNERTIEYLNYVGFYPVQQISLLSNENALVTIKIEQKAPTDVAYEIIVPEMDIQAYGTISSLTDLSIEKATLDYNSSYDLTIEASDSVIGSFKIINKMSSKIGEKIDMPSITNTIKEEDMTTEDQNKISAGITAKIVEILPGFDQSLFYPESSLDSYKSSFESDAKMLVSAVEYKTSLATIDSNIVAPKIGNITANVDDYGLNPSDYSSVIIENLNPVTISITTNDNYLFGKFSARVTKDSVTYLPQY